jgi:hypothetical protein
MKLVKVIPKSQRAKNRVKEHGETMEILLDNSETFMVRSLEKTWSYPDGSKGKWLGNFTKEEATWEEVE